jgi:hypothetical protein
MVTADKVTQITQNIRSITVIDGPAVKTKKGKKSTFQVKEVRLSWYEDTPPTYATAHGSFHNGHFTVNCSRKYDLDGTEPKWLKKLINNA